MKHNNWLTVTYLACPWSTSGPLCWWTARRPWADAAARQATGTGCCVRDNTALSAPTLPDETAPALLNSCKIPGFAALRLFSQCIAMRMEGRKLFIIQFPLSVLWAPVAAAASVSHRHSGSCAGCDSAGGVVGGRGCDTVTLTRGQQTPASVICQRRKKKKKQMNGVCRQHW